MEHDQIVLLAKTKLNIIEVLICKTLIDSYISHEKFILVNNMFKKYDEMKKEINKALTIYQGFQFLYKTKFSYCLKCKKNAESKNPKVVKTKREKPMLFWKCAVNGSKNQDLSKRIKNTKI